VCIDSSNQSLVFLVETSTGSLVPLQDDGISNPCLIQCGWCSLCRVGIESHGVGVAQHPE